MRCLTPLMWEKPDSNVWYFLYVVYLITNIMHSARLVTSLRRSWFLVLCRDQDLLTRIGSATALEVRATGIQYTFAPCIAVCRDPRWGRCYESYSEDPSLVSNMTTIIDGLQGKAPANWSGPYLRSRSGNFFLLKLRVICKASCRDCMVNRSVNSHHVSK